jgi:hypothetical protein
MALTTQAAGDKAVNADEWGEFLHLPGEKFYDFNKIRDESYEIQKPRLERMQAFPLYPSISASTLQMSLHSPLSIFLG